MYLVWGDGEDRAVLGHLPEDACPACGKKTRYIVYVDYTYCHIWHMFSFVLERKYRKVCNTCGADDPYTRAEARLRFTVDKIPFMRKNGWLVCLAIVSLVAGFVFFTHRIQRARLGAAVAGAREGDVFLAELNRLPNSGFFSHPRNTIYGCLMLLELRANGEFLVATSDKGFNGKSALKLEIKEGMAFFFDTDNPLLLFPDDLVRLHDAGIIYDILPRGTMKVKRPEPPKIDRVRYNVAEYPEVREETDSSIP